MLCCSKSKWLVRRALRPVVLDWIEVILHCVCQLSVFDEIIFVIEVKLAIADIPTADLLSVLSISPRRSAGLR